MRIKYLFAVLIILSGAVLSGGILFFPNLFSYKSIAKTSSEWTQKTGEGISAPACGSSSTSAPTCSGTTPNVTFSWSITQGSTVDDIQIVITRNSDSVQVFNSFVCGNGQSNSCGQFTGSYTWTGGAVNTNYSWVMYEHHGTPVPLIGSGSFITPNCAPLIPSVNIKANGSNGPITIASGESAIISWSSESVSSCTVSPTGWTGTSNEGISTGPLTSSQTYAINCTGPNGPASDSVVVNVSGGGGGGSLSGSCAYNPNPCDTGSQVDFSWNSNDSLLNVICGSLPSSQVAGTDHLLAICPATPYTCTFSSATGKSGSFSCDLGVNGAPPPRFSCSGAGGACALDPSGPYTTSNCDGACSAPPRFSCSGAGGACALDPSGPYTTSDCGGLCAGNPYLPGDVLVRATLDGAPWSGLLNIGISYPGWGIPSILVAVPGGFSGMPPETYTVNYVSGGPSGATFQSITPFATQTLTSDGTIFFWFNFTTPSLPGNFTLNPPSAACNSVSLSWTASAGADAYRILKGAARVDITPYQPYTALNFVDFAVSQNTSYLYQIEAYNSTGTNRSNARNVTTPYCPPTLDFSGNPTSIYQGQSTTLTWSTTFATSCTASGAWNNSKPINGSEIVIPSPPPSVTYTLTCTGLGGSTGPRSAVINIAPLALPEWKEIIPR